MKRVKNLFRMAMVALATIAFAACDEVTKPQEEQKPQVNENLTLAVDVEDITATTAKIKVSHDGQATDTWFGFLTEEVDISEQELIEVAAAEFVASGSYDGLRKSKNYVTIVKELKPETAYKYIAFGLTTDGVVYGNSSSVEFTTEAEQSTGGGDNTDPEDGTVNGMTPNPAWSLQYVGADTLHEQKFDHVVKVTSRDTNPYVVTVVYASEYNPKDLRELGETLIVELKEYLAYFNNANGTNYTLNDVLYRGDGAEAFDLVPGQYKAVAIGIRADGTLSGLYATSDTFEVKEPIATDLYNAWLGQWYVQGSNSVIHNLNLTKGIANKTIYMTGWSNISDWPVEVEYDAELDALFFFSQTVATGVDFGSYGVGDVYFLGFDDDGYFYTNGTGDYGIAIAGILDTGARAIVRYGVGVTDYPEFNRMSFMAKIGEDYYSVADIEKDVMNFPAVFSREPIVAQYKATSRCRYTNLQRPTSRFRLTPVTIVK